MKEQLINKEPEKTGRRKFLSRIWSILGLVALAELAFFTVSMLRPGKKNLKDNPGSILKLQAVLKIFLLIQ